MPLDRRQGSVKNSSCFSDDFPQEYDEFYLCWYEWNWNQKVAEKTLKTADNLGIATEKAKGIALKAKEKVSESVSDNSESPVNYAIDKVHDNAKSVSKDAIYLFNKQGKKSVNETVKNTKKLEQKERLKMIKERWITLINTHPKHLMIQLRPTILYRKTHQRIFKTKSAVQAVSKQKKPYLLLNQSNLS